MTDYLNRNMPTEQPSNPQPGQMYVDLETGSVMVWNREAWIDTELVFERPDQGIGTSMSATVSSNTFNLSNQFIVTHDVEHEYMPSPNEPDLLPDHLRDGWELRLPSGERIFLSNTHLLDLHKEQNQPEKTEDVKSKEQNSHPLYIGDDL